MKWISVAPMDTEIDGDGEYSILDPNSLYRGRTYSDWTSDWLNWFLSAEADKRNSGPVVFLRSKGKPIEQDCCEKGNGNSRPEIPIDPGVADVSGLMGYSSPYSNDPNIKVGGDRLQISEDQAVFVPIIVAYWLKSSPYADWGGMQDRTGLTIDYGDNPPHPERLTINGYNIDLPKPSKGEEDLIDTETESGPHRLMERFRITTSIFTAIVPEAGYGRSSKDFIEEAPLAPSNYPAMVDGYFVMLKFKPGIYWIHSWASAPREARGPYFSELLYQIEVGKRKPLRGMATTRRPARNDLVLSRIFETKNVKGDLTAAEIKRFKSYVPTGDKKIRKPLF